MGAHYSILVTFSEGLKMFKIESWWENEKLDKQGGKKKFLSFL